MDRDDLNHDSAKDVSFLDGQMLIAMPAMGDPRFERSVIYMCAHSEDGAMGLIINQQADNINFVDLLKQLDITSDEDAIHLPPTLQDVAVHVGGPVATGRGFVLHSTDYYAEDSTLNIDDTVSLTATLDILRAMAVGDGPDKALLALGYAGWSPGQLEQEFQANGWLHCDADAELIFSDDIGAKYDKALEKLGISSLHLVNDAGHA